MVPPRAAHGIHSLLPLGLGSAVTRIIHIHDQLVTSGLDALGDVEAEAIVSTCTTERGMFKSGSYRRYGGAKRCTIALPV
jgi:hypothetical protein